MLLSTILCDFDGTITEVDTNEIILDKFSKRQDWQREDRLYEAGEITLEECMSRQFGPVNATESELVSLVDGVKVRKGFKELVDYCRVKGIEFIVVSAGIDFIIQKKLRDLGTTVKVVSPTVKITPEGVRFTFPRVQGVGPDFKTRLLNAAKEKGKPVCYIGDGASDYAAASEADLIFAIRGSSLASFCKVRGLDFKAVGDFFGVISILNDRL